MILPPQLVDIIVEAGLASIVLCIFCWLLTLTVLFLTSKLYVKVASITLCLCAAAGAVSPFFPPWYMHPMVSVVCAIALSLLVVIGSLRGDIALRKRRQRKTRQIT